MPPSYFPLRWESTGNQWWYASPIDWAAANGHYDLVRELLHIDPNLLIKLTSLRRIRRLETVWDDEAQFKDVAKCRSQVARKLLLECESKRGSNSLIRAGYGGWLLYTAASAGDVTFVQELLDRDPLLVFGEGEYGVTDIFYAAARSKNSEVFRLLFDFSVSPRCLMSSGGVLEEQPAGPPPVFRSEMVSRAVHAAARGGNLEILKDLLGDCTDILVYRDAQGSTVLHAAAGRGQVEVVKDLVASFDIITSTDNQGNTALHLASYRGHLPVVEALIIASPSSISLTNNGGDTFLHMAVSGFRMPGFRRLDQQIELMKQLICGKIANIQDVINIRNNDGRTALHMAVLGNIHSNLVELLITAPSINLNICDIDGMTSLDLLSQRPQSASSELLIKQLISAGGVSSCQGCMARSSIVSHQKMQGIGGSPGTSFRVTDAEIFLYTGIENASDAGDQISETCSSELSNLDSVDGNHSTLDGKKQSSVNYAKRRLKILLRWPGRKEKKSEGSKKLGDDDPMASYRKWSDLEEIPTPLRQQFSKPSSLPNNKRVLPVISNLPSPSTKKKFAAGLMHGVIQAFPYITKSDRSPSSSFSISTRSSPISLDRQKGIHSRNESAGPSCSNQSLDDDGTLNMNQKPASVNKKLMNHYFCFGAQDLALEDPVNALGSNQGHKRSLLSIA
ncbi:PREDICTED: serine/threonine-protein phosphatase 6 regulatory ankyrin repeat subunit B-like [Nelumbo nucifera]|uniref:Serine/threonine-protein phosphatase 6 regulatory ankyrin repeat subunit B-like n=1 Tax=Nelumbo nucifera TaxID=4432 RepID=A0A1U7ZLU0_NELNU|nr:PREDICTED: serine/threonine-protein phosphatase 6 regulatory ankyrin repeat subunit B-like [Nelumbo nucifera]